MPSNQSAEVLKCLQMKLKVLKFGSLSPRSQFAYAVKDTPKRVAISALFLCPRISFNFSPNFSTIK